MPFPVLAAIQGATALYGALKGAGRGRRSRAGDLTRRFRAERVSGYTSPEDVAAAELTRLSGSQAAARSATLARTNVSRSATARGLGGSSVAALNLGADRINAQGREAAALAAGQQLYGSYLTNQGYERGKQIAGFNAEMGNEIAAQGRADAQQAGFWNSVSDMIPGALDGLSALGRSPAAFAGSVARDTRGIAAQPDPMQPRGTVPRPARLRPGFAVRVPRRPRY